MVSGEPRGPQKVGLSIIRPTFEFNSKSTSKEQLHRTMPRPDQKVGRVGTWTLNRLTDETAEEWSETVLSMYAFCQQCIDDSAFRFMRFSLERETRDHIQGMFYCTNQVSWGYAFGVFKPIFPTIHLDKMGKYNADRALAYCDKKGSGSDYPEIKAKAHTQLDGPFDFGDMPKQGQRVDIERLFADAALVRAGQKRKSAFMDDHKVAVLRHPRFIEKHVCEPAYKGKRCNIFIYGPPGCTKTTGAKKLFPEAKSINPDYANCRLNGYEDQDCIIIDNFRWSSLGKGRNWLLSLLDDHAVDVNAFGKMVPFMAKVIIITSVEPMPLPGSESVAQKEFWRRISTYYAYNELTHEFVREENPHIVKQTATAAFVEPDTSIPFPDDSVSTPVRWSE